MKPIQPANNAKNKAARPEGLTKDAIFLSNGSLPGAFLESALQVLGSQQPVWVPSPEELAEMQQQQSMLTMMAAIKQGDKLDFGSPFLESIQVPQEQQNHVLSALANIGTTAQARPIIQIEIEKEFVNIDSTGSPEGDHRVTLGVGSRAVFAKSANSAAKLNIPVACFVASIKDEGLAIAFHYGGTGNSSINIELGEVPNARMNDSHIELFTQKFNMLDQQARVFAMTIAMQSMGFKQSLTSGFVQELADQYKVDFDGMLRLAVNIEKWRVMNSQARISY